MNKKSGVYGMTGISSDFRDIEDAAAQNNELAQVALESYAKKVKKYIGSYAAEMNGVDAVVFTAGVGENGIDMRADIMDTSPFEGSISPERIFKKVDLPAPLAPISP